MAYTVWETSKTYGPRRGLEGPFTFANGRVLYYDVKAGQYYDPTCDWYVSDEEMAIIPCDWYVSDEEMAIIHNQLLDVIRG